MFTSAPAMFVSPPDSCVRSWCPCDCIRRWGPGETLIMRVEPSEMGSVLLQKDHGALPHFSLWGPHGPNPDPDPDPNHTWPSASRIIYCLLTPWLGSFFIVTQRDPGPPLTLLPWNNFCARVLCVCCVLYMCCVCVLRVCVPCVCCVCVVLNKATDSHILQGWALVADQTSMISFFQALCSRSSLIVMRVILSHLFHNFKYLLHAGRRGRDWRPDIPSWVAPGCGYGPPAGVLGSGDHLM